MNALFTDPAVEARVIRAARWVERDAQYGRNPSLSLAEFAAAREEQLRVRVERAALLRQTTAIRC